MVKQITRTEAMSWLSRIYLARMAPAEREDLLLDWWPLDQDDNDYKSLPIDIQEEISRSSSPESPATDERYDNLLQLGLRHKLRGVTNTYLQKRLLSEGAGDFEVVGPIEPLEACPCCRFRTLSGRGMYEICPVCFWEDEGNDEPERYSGPNHMTLKGARSNFERVGAISEAALAHVPADAAERYVRE